MEIVEEYSLKGGFIGQVSFTTALFRKEGE